MNPVFSDFFSNNDRAGMAFDTCMSIGQKRYPPAATDIGTSLEWPLTSSIVLYCIVFKYLYSTPQQP